MKYSLGISLLCSILPLAQSLPAYTRSSIQIQKRSAQEEKIASGIPVLAIGDLSEFGIDLEELATDTIFGPIEVVERRSALKAQDPVGDEPWPPPPEVEDDSPPPFDKRSAQADETGSEAPAAPGGLEDEEEPEIIIIELEPQERQEGQEQEDGQQQEMERRSAQATDEDHLPPGGPIKEHPEKQPSPGTPPLNRRAAQEASEEGASTMVVLDENDLPVPASADEEMNDLAELLDRRNSFQVRRDDEPEDEDNNTSGSDDLDS